MSDALAVRLTGVGKMYKLFKSRADNLLDAVGLAHLVPWHRVEYREFWALRGIDLELRTGQRIGIIGRNGAGKSTLLKLLTGNLAPTEGSVEVTGQVQALLDAGAGFHPDFTGYENIRAALIYQGLKQREIAEAEAEIAEFTELGQFLGQPFKTYSAGMQARLAFATATVVKPEILIIDEILGAGDAYFIAKSTERMKQLVDTGASVLLVSHAMTQITQMCEIAIWLDRGEIVMMGESLDVVKAYEQFIRKLDDRRLQAKNIKRRTGISPSSVELDNPGVDLYVAFGLDGPGDSRLEIDEVRLLRGGEVLDTISVGGPQDVNAAHSGFVILDYSSWSSPLETGDRFFRRIGKPSGDEPGLAQLYFNVLVSEGVEEWELEIDYRLSSNASASVTVVANHSPPRSLGVLRPSEDWQRARLAIRPDEVPLTTALAAVGHPGASTSGISGPVDDDLSHWPGEGLLHVRRVELLDGFDQPCTVFEVDSTLRVKVVFDVDESDTYELLPVVNIYRIDGVNVTTQLGEWLTRRFDPGTSYVISIAMYKSFDPYLNEPPKAYDWVDRSVEFKVVGAPPAITSVFLHPSTWRLE
jgi:lipopolysaccharide transport system ATP-binding protein